jgi:glycosyltransferase involved in cell wall biosynthesis
MNPRTLSIVIPAYNEAARLSSTLTALQEQLDRDAIEIIVVDDGSRDDTSDVAERALRGARRARVIRLPENQGKGAAVRAGVLAATGDVVLFMDADMATDLEGLPGTLAALDHADVVIGSRAVPGSVVQQASLGRAVMGRVFNRLVRLFSRLDVHDTQCGFKAFHASTAHLLFSLSREDGFAFDPEILIRARILGFRIVEVPVTWTAVEGSSVRPLYDSARTLFQLVRCVVRARPARVRADAQRLGWMPGDRALVEVVTGKADAAPDRARERDGSAA